jgi:exopolysaccharide biosynthesis protein
LDFNKNGRWLYLVVVDGRQPLYSAGATFDELADILMAHGAYFGMSLDGGGSTTMVIEGADGQPVILNSPIDQYVPGRERPVANHIGIFLNR